MSEEAKDEVRKRWGWICVFLCGLLKEDWESRKRRLGAGNHDWKI